MILNEKKNICIYMYIYKVICIDMYKYLYTHFSKKSISQRHSEGPDSDPASFPLGDHYLRGETLQGGRKGEKLEIG